MDFDLKDRPGERIHCSASSDEPSGVLKIGLAVEDRAMRHMCRHRQTVFVGCMSDLEKFLHARDDKLPLLIRAGLVHHQFETVHPFLDGNGRLGRLLITLLLCSEGILSEPILYLSLYFKTHRREYYSQLQQVRETGDWESWLKFFLVGVHDIAVQATEAAREILGLIQADRVKIAAIGRGAGSALQTHQYLERKPLAVIPEMVKALNLTTPTVTAALQNLSSVSCEAWRSLFRNRGIC